METSIIKNLINIYFMNNLSKEDEYLNDLLNKSITIVDKDIQQEFIDRVKKAILLLE